MAIIFISIISLYLQNITLTMTTKKDNKLPVFNQYETVSPATKLLQKRRKMYEIHEQFQAKKDDFKNQQTEFKSGEDDLKQKDKDLQNKLTAFCQFLQQNESKRKKAEQRFKQEEKAYAEKEDTIKNLQRQIEQLKRSQKKYQTRAAYLRKYQDFLQKVRSTYSQEYPQMSDILNRYNTLKKSNDDRIRERETMQHNHQILKRQTLAEQKKYNQQILTINNQIKDWSRKVQDKIKEKNEVQSEVEQSNQDFSKKNLNLGKIFLAIDNLNYRCNENNYKLKYQFDEKGTTEKKQIKNKKIEGDTNLKNDEELSYQQKSKQASIKLKNITTHMKDFKAIIDEFKLQTKHKQEKS